MRINVALRAHHFFIYSFYQVLFKSPQLCPWSVLKEPLFSEQVEKKERNADVHLILY